MQHGRFTFFEQATQNGLVVAVMSKYIHKSSHSYDLIVDRESGKRYYRLFKVVNPDEPYFVYPIPDRSLNESSTQWAARVTKELEAVWKVFNSKAERDARGTPAGSGEGSTAPSASPDSPSGASSTDAPPQTETSPSEPVTAAEPEPTASVPARPQGVLSKPKPRSSRASAAR